jgi:flavin reductase (DIM6/NTAB) family NADH-FMN oxidoreductase RutF
MRKIIPEEMNSALRHHFLLGTVNPRPICFASTVDKKGKPNLAPYSFFNIFSSNPPVFVFSVNNRRDGSKKDTLLNIEATGEVVINLVNYPIARQMAICGIEYDADINEFEKGGFTPQASEMVKPWRVAESPVQFECKVLEIKNVNPGPGGANLVIAQALLIHADEKIFTPEDHIDPDKLDMVGRLGNFNYCRVKGDSVFAIRQPQNIMAIGFDNLPGQLRKSTVLTGHHLALLAGQTSLPDQKNTKVFAETPEIKEFLHEMASKSTSEKEILMHHKIKELLDSDKIEEAWMMIQIISF